MSADGPSRHLLVGGRDADEGLVPAGVRSGEARIRHYAERFDTVEANSTYYRLPDAELVGNWAERTPDGFTMHVKAFGLMTRHPVKLEALPEDLRDVMPVDERGRVDRPPRELRAEVFRRFARALEPLRERGKLGGILLQFPLVRRLQARSRSSTSSGRRRSSRATSCWSSSATGAGSTTRTGPRRSRSSSRAASPT